MSTPGTIPGNSLENFPQPNRLYDGTDTEYDLQPDADASVEQPDPTPTNPAAQNTICVITQSRIVRTIIDIDSVPQPSTERIRTLSGNPRNWYA